MEQAIRSVLDQTYGNLELILVDDGSTDNTRDVAAAIDDPRLRYVYQENAGACAARNHGVALAKGEFIAFHDSDDIWCKEKLEKQMEAMEKSACDVLFCKLAMKTREGETVVYPKYIGQGPVSRQNDIFGVGTQTVLTRAEVCREERFDEAMPRYQDFEWLYRVSGRYAVECLDEPLVEYRIGQDSISTNYGKMEAALRLFLQKHPGVRRESPLVSMHAVRNLLEGIRGSAKAGKPRDAVQFAGLLPRYYPGLIRYLAAKRRMNPSKAR